MKFLCYTNNIVGGMFRMNDWKMVKNVNLLTEMFGYGISFKNGEVAKIRYDGKKGMIGVKCQNGYCVDKIYCEIWFRDVRLFQIGYDKNTNLINEIKIKSDNRGMELLIESYYLRVVCGDIAIEKVKVLESNERSTGDYKPSDTQVKLLRDLLDRGI